MSTRALRVGWRPGGLHRLATAAGVARYRVVRADPGARALVVGLHGYGSDERQIATLIGLDLGPVVYLAPRAPLADGDGFSWFDLGIGPDGRVVPGDTGPAVQAVAAFTAAASRAWGTRRAALVGYSQGGALALRAWAAGGPFDAVAAVAGGVPPVPDSVPSVPLFVGHGTLDPFTSAADVRQSVAALAAGDVTLHESAAPHVVTAEQRAALSAWLRGRGF